MLIRYAFIADKQAQTIPEQLPSLFISKEKALNALQNAIENMVVHENEIQNWELVEMHIAVLPNAISKYR